MPEDYHRCENPRLAPGAGDDGQQARIQVGKQLGYRVTTTTETSTLENVQFLDLGVVLEVTPHISRDGRVLIKVMPKVSTGRVNPDTAPGRET